MQIAVHIFLKHIYSIGIILHCNELASQCKPYIYSCRRPDLHLQLSGFRRSFPIMKKISLWHGTVKRQQQQSGTSWRKHHRKIVKAFKAHVKASRRVAVAEEFFQVTQKALSFTAVEEFLLQWEKKEVPRENKQNNKGSATPVEGLAMLNTKMKREKNSV